MTAPPDSAALRHLTLRLGAVAAGGLLLGVVGFLLAHPTVLLLGGLVVFVASSLAAVLPAGMALAFARRRPDELPDGLRNCALLVAAASVACGLLVMRSRTPGDLAVGALMMAAGAAVAWSTLRRPLPRPAMPPLLNVLAVLPVLLSAGALTAVNDGDEQFHHDWLKTTTRQVANWQAEFRADSGRYAEQAELDSLLQLPSETRVVLRREGGGYRAVVTFVTLPEAQCAVFVDASPEPPATRPGEVACIPELRQPLALFAAAWLAALIVAAVAARMMRPPFSQP